MEFCNGSTWIAVGSGGAQSVLQTLSFSTTTTASSSSSTYVTTGLTLTITPTSASNKVLVRVTTVVSADGIGCYRQAQIDLRRGGTSLGQSVFISYESSGNNDHAVPMSIEYLDSPATTSATTYILYFRRDWSSNLCGNAAIAQYNGSLGTITVQEVTP